MKATLFDGGKVHLLADKGARCGVGKHCRQRQWQTDWGEVTCRRCVKLRLADQRRLVATDAPNPDGAQGRR